MFGRSKERAREQERQQKPTAAVGADDIQVKRDLVDAIERELEAMRVADAEATEKPPGKYRIYRVERADPTMGADGYYVQTWRVGQSKYELRYKHERTRARAYALRNIKCSWDIEEVWYLDQALSWEHPPHLATYIEWINVGSANPHATYEDAAEWLRKWLRPEKEEVYLDEGGKPLKTRSKRSTNTPHI